GGPALGGAGDAVHRDVLGSVVEPERPRAVEVDALGPVTGGAHGLPTNGGHLGPGPRAGAEVVEGPAGGLGGHAGKRRWPGPLRVGDAAASPLSSAARRGVEQSGSSSGS